MITAIILQSREDIQKTLDSVSWCDEIIVIKPGKINDFSKVRNEAIAKAKNEWVLFLDDDEEISDELKKEIPVATGMTSFEGLYLKRMDFFMGKFLKYGETGNIKLLRLGKKGTGKWEGIVHETWNIKNSGELKNTILHYPHPTIKSFIDQINYYTTLRAKELKFSEVRLFFYPLAKFIQNYFFKLGFLDGYAGFVMAFMMSLHSLIVGVKLIEHQ